MTFKLTFKEEAFKEWKRLDPTLQKQFKKKLEAVLKNPRIQSAKLRGMENCYKIKLRSSGYRLVYQVRDNELIITVVAVGKRERNEAYKAAIGRI